MPLPGIGGNGQALSGLAGLARQSGTATRLYDLDAMRGVLMTLGVILHSARPFSVSGGWLVEDPVRWQGFDALVWFIHLFRIPAFFILAGFFASLTLRRYGVAVFARVRTERLLVPLFFTLILVNSLQLYLLTSFRAGYNVPVVDFVRTALIASWTHALCVSHLWFLVLASLYQVIPVVLSAGAGRFEQLTLGVPKAREQLLVLLALPLYPVLLRAVGNKLPPVIYWNVGDAISGIELFMSLPYFVFGVWLFGDESRLARFARPKRWHLLLALPAAFCVSAIGESNPSFVGRAAYRYGREALVWLSCLYCFWLFHRFFNHKSKAWGRFSDASYTMYLFHQVLVLIYAHWLIQASLPIGLKFLIVVSLTYLTAYGLHRMVIRRTSVLSWMFNGKRLHQGAALPDT